MVKIIPNSSNFVQFQVNGPYDNEITNLLRVLMGKPNFFLEHIIQIDTNFEVKQTNLKSIIQH